MFKVKKLMSSSWKYPFIMVVLIFLFEFFLVFLNRAFLPMLLLFSFIAYCLVYLAVCLVQLSFLRRISRLLGPLVLTVAIVSLSAYFRGELHSFFEKGKILIEPKFSICREQAVPVGKQYFLGVCEQFDEAISALDPGLYNTIIYDSSGEIMLDDSMRSKSWKEAAEKLKFQYVIEPPERVGTTGEVIEIKKITGHYYSVHYCSACVIEAKDKQRIK
jgi:hypothetical protein